MRLGALIMATTAATVLGLLGPTVAAADTLVASPEIGQLTEGVPYTGKVASFTDAPADDVTADYSANIDWGDGTQTTATITMDGTSSGPWGVSSAPTGHAYAEEGTYAVTVTIHDNFPSVDYATTTLVEQVNVRDAPLAMGPTTPQTFTSGGAITASAALVNYETAIGGTNNGTKPGDQGGGFRHLNWDTVKVDGSEPGSVVITPHVVEVPATRMSAYGIEFEAALAVANDGFVSVNPNATGLFPAFSAPNVAAPFNTNAIELDFVTPGSMPPQPQTSSGLGVMFLNVRQPGTTITYLNGNSVLATQLVPTTAGAGHPSFAGALFSAPVVTGVSINLGGAAIFSFDGKTSTPGPPDSAGTNLVAIDDIALAEPHPSDATISVLAGAQFSGKVATFLDTDPNGAVGDYTATIQWGDGTRSPGTITPNPSGAFDVSGAHRYAQAGTFEAVVTIADVGGEQHVSDIPATVAARPTTTAVSCAPPSVVVSRATVCTATVTDAGGSGSSAPTGTAALSSPAAGLSAGTCTLAATSTAGRASCGFSYTPPDAGAETVTATYRGDGAHASSSGAGTVTAAPPRCTPSVRSPKLVHGKLAVQISCTGALAVHVTVTEVVTRKGSHRGARLQFGTGGATFGAAGTLMLVVKPSHAASSELRAATKHGQRISLTVTVTASSGSKTVSTVTVPIRG
jgi:hypothetical protein